MQKFKLNYILCLVFVLVLCPFSILAEEPEQGEVIIHTDGTYSDHEVIEACEVGSMVKLDIGSFDTAYINNNFDVNANIDGFIYFECGTTNDIKLAYYGINQTIYSDDITKFNDTQLNILSSFNYNSDDLIIVLQGTNVFFSYNVSKSDNLVTMHGYSWIPTNGIIDSSYNNSTFDINNDVRFIYYLKVDGELYYNGLPVYELTLNVSPDNSGTTTGSGMYWENSVVNISTNSSNPKYIFSGWSDGDMNKSRNITLSSDLTLTANYVELIENKVIKLVTYTNPVVVFKPYDEGVTNYTYLYYDKITTYYGYELDVYDTTTDDGYILYQSGVSTYTITNAQYKTNTCTPTYWPCSPPTLPTAEKTIADSFYDGSIYVVASVPSGAIEVYNPSSDSLIENGNDASQSATDINNNQNQELDLVISEYNEIESQFKDNLDSSLNDIDFSFDFGNITDFSTSANFVRAQFDNLTNNPFGSLVGFSLAVGLALLIMGRRL